MVLSEEGEDQLHQKLLELCSKLNLDQKTINEAWDNFCKINKNIILEGDALHWLGCAVFVAAQNIETPTLLSTAVMRGNGMTITSLLKHSNLSFVQFFSNIIKWADMSRMPESFTQKITYMKDTFSVAHNTFKEYYPIFCKIFVPPKIQEFEQKQPRNRKQNFSSRPVQCTSSKVFEFIWNLFIIIKAENTKENYSTDLVKSFHLLYCCIDLAFKNAFLAERRDLINPNFECLPPNWSSPCFQVPDEAPCTIPFMCKCSLTLTDAMHMKTYTMKTLISNLVRQKVLQMDPTNFTGVFDMDNFESNFRNISSTYDTILVNKGSIDERIFLAEYRRQLLEQQNLNLSSVKASPYVSGDALTMDSPRIVTPRDNDTPTTNSRFLGPREADTSPQTTDRTTTQRITRLHNLLNGRSAAPSESLVQFFKSCNGDPIQKIQNILGSMGDKFTAHYSQMCNEDEARNRLQIGITFFYKFIESILHNEKSIKKDISGLIQKDLFYQCMFACSMEIILFTYGSQCEFPWILDVLQVQPIDFVKVIEPIVRSKEPLSRELIQHLNRVEETVIESLAWKTDSQLWDTLLASGQDIPKFEDTALPGHLLYNDKANKAQENSDSPNNNNSMQSLGSSATDCFQSPISEGKSTVNTDPSTNELVIRKTTHILIKDKDGNNRLIPVIESEKVNNGNSENKNPLSTSSSPATTTPTQPKRTGSLSIIFRKFYNLAGDRMEHLCSKLGLTDNELKHKIWTVFEDSIRNSDLIKDRHLDQLLMCAIYMICRITKLSVKFQDIMKFYREQPQCSSKVYRSVLFKRAVVQEDGIIVPEVRNDLISFYNSIYVDVMQKFAVKFRNSSQSNLLLSPLPAIRRDLVSPSVQIVGNVFVKPLESPSTTSGQCFNYFFSRSPSKDLKDINKLVNNSRVAGKRLLVDNDLDTSPSKRISNRKLQSLVEERRSQNTE